MLYMKVIKYTSPRIFVLASYSYTRMRWVDYLLARSYQLIYIYIYYIYSVAELIDSYEFQFMVGSWNCGRKTPSPSDPRSELGWNAAFWGSWLSIETKELLLSSTPPGAPPLLRSVWNLLLDDELVVPIDAAASFQNGEGSWRLEFTGITTSLFDELEMKWWELWTSRLVEFWWSVDNIPSKKLSSSFSSNAV